MHTRCGRFGGAASAWADGARAACCCRGNGIGFLQGWVHGRQKSMGGGDPAGRSSIPYARAAARIPRARAGSEENIGKTNRIACRVRPKSSQFMQGKRQLRLALPLAWLRTLPTVAVGAHSLPDLY